MTPTEFDLLERRRVELEKALAESELRVAASPPHSAQYSDYRRQEAEHERRDLLQQRGQVERKLKQARETLDRHFRVFRRRKPDDPEQQRRIASLDALEAERKESITNFVRHLEAEGDYRQARIWRATLADVRQQIAREYGYT